MTDEIKDRQTDEITEESAAVSENTAKNAKSSKKGSKKGDSKKKESYATFQYTTKSYFKGNLQAFFTRRFNMFMVFFAIFLCLYSVMRAIQDPAEVKMAIASVGVVILFLAVLYPAMLLLESYNMVNKNAVFSKQVRFSFSQVGIRFSATGDSLTYNWTEMKRVKETKKYIIFALPFSRAVFVPKEYLSAEQLTNLRTEIRRRIAAKDYLLYK